MPDIFTSPAKKRKLVNLIKPNSVLKQTFASYLFLPKDMRFETQSEGETIVLLIRKHWINNLSWMLVGIILLISPFFLFPVIYFSGLFPVYLPASFFNTLVLFWYLLSFTYIFIQFLLWYFTVSIITDERIIDIDYENILNKKFAETRITKVEDVTMRAGGFLKVFFNYGDVIVQTAAKEHQFFFESVPYPDKIVKIINELMGVEEQEHSGGSHL